MSCPDHRFRTKEILLEHTSLTKQMVAFPVECNECGHRFMNATIVNKWSIIKCPKCGETDRGYCGHA